MPSSTLRAHLKKARNAAGRMKRRLNGTAVRNAQEAARQEQRKAQEAAKALKKARERAQKAERQANQQQRRYEGALARIRTLKKEVDAHHRFFSDLMREPLLSTASLATFARFRREQPTFVMGVAANMLNDPVTRQAGTQLMIRLQFDRKIYTHVVDLAEGYPSERIPADCFGEVAFSYAVAAPDRLPPLVRQFVALRREALAAAGAPPDRFHWDIETGLQACILANAPDELSALLDLAPAPSDSTTPRYALVLSQAREWLAKQSRRIDDIVRPGSTTFGLLSYGSPLKPSSNIGDYVQTIAMMGLMARALPRDTVIHGGGEETLERIVSGVETAYSAADGGMADLVWIDRDDPTTTPAGGPIYLPVNGWFMHPKVQGHFDFPFADNIRPFFIGMHINQPQMLTGGAIDYLRRFAPIGTRDYHTAELLMANGVDAFFSGCPTLTLDTIFGRKSRDARDGRYYAAHRKKKDDPVDHETRIHMDPGMPVWSKDKSLDVAWSYLEDYAAAEAVITPLLHCYLPCRAFDTPVSFTHENAATDPRFEGLIGIPDEARDSLATEMRRLVLSLMQEILCGADEEAIYARWRALTESRVEAVRERMRRNRPALPDTVSRSDVAVDNLAPVQFVAGRPADGPTAGDYVDVVFCYDENFSRAIYPTVRSILRNTDAAVRLTLLTRGIDEGAASEISATFPDTRFIWIDVSKMDFEGLKLLRHTTTSTMDRLFLPKLLRHSTRAIYLDVDMVVLGDIRELYEWDLQGKSIGARRTIFPGWDAGFGLAGLIEKQLTSDQILSFRREFLYSRPMDFACFNAGMQVLDLEKLRDQDFTERMVGMVHRYGINDQYAVNLFAAGDFAEIPAAWNHFATQEHHEDPRIIHYTGYVKPWELEYCPKAELWRQYMEPADGLEMTSAFSKEWFR